MRDSGRKDVFGPLGLEWEEGDHTLGARKITERKRGQTKN